MYIYRRKEMRNMNITFSDDFGSTRYGGQNYLGLVYCMEGFGGSKGPPNSEKKIAKKWYILMPLLPHA